MRAPVARMPRARDEAALSPEAEALRAQLAAGRDETEPSFADWRRSQRGGQVFAWVMTFALLSPGVLCFLFQAPIQVSSGLEVVGMIANWWLRRERWRRLRDIAAWDAPPSSS